MITPGHVRGNLATESDHVAGTGLLALEDTHNMRGGRAIEPEALAAAADVAHDAGVPVHLDGARLGNAAVALGLEPAALTGAVDSVMLSLSKGLGAPVGSVLGGPEAFIQRAHRARKQYGGGMRQAGLIAAPGLLALGNVDRLAEDHARCDRLAAGLDGVDGLDVQPPETNILMVSTEPLGATAAAFLEALEAEGVKASPVGERRIRFVTHRDVGDEDVDAAVAAAERAAS